MYYIRERRPLPTSGPPTPQPASPSPPPPSASPPTPPSHPQASTSAPHPTGQRNTRPCRQTAVSTRDTATGSVDATPSSASRRAPLRYRTWLSRPRASRSTCTRPVSRSGARGRRGGPLRRAAGGRRINSSSTRLLHPSLPGARPGGRCRLRRGV